MQFREARAELAAAFRWAARPGRQSGICNHFSLAPDPAHGLINPQGLHWPEITASSLVLPDTEGETVEGDGAVEPTAFHIHTAVHRKVPSATCVRHAHLPCATALARTDGDRPAPAFQALDEQTTGHFAGIRRRLDRGEPEYRE